LDCDNPLRVTSYLSAVAVLAMFSLVPGADTATVARQALLGGRRDGFRAAYGVTAGLLLWGLLTVAGLAALLAASEWLFTVVRVAGAAYLVSIGVRAFWRSRRAETDLELPRGREAPLRAGLTTNLLNPKIAIFYVTVLPTLASTSSSTPLLVGLVATHAILSLCWLCACASLLARGRNFLWRPAAKRWLDRATGTVLVGFGLAVAADTR